MFLTNAWGFWLICFLVIKLGGSMLAAWSYWWVLFPVIPVLVALFRALGVLG